MSKNGTKKRRPYEKKPKRNLEIRAMIASEGIEYSEIAERIYVSRSTLSQWMSYDLSDEKRQMIVDAVNAIKGSYESERVQRV